jgi:hypothetical protein
MSNQAIKTILIMVQRELVEEIIELCKPRLTLEVLQLLGAEGTK